ncbi:dihydrofolate reductase-like domain-containing protein [Pavlovales sp. CCMP2436]|nr:dihydrofolate reductase-like domain-containing protein [Pavlovales sp. CCMP2436]
MQRWMSSKVSLVGGSAGSRQLQHLLRFPPQPAETWRPAVTVCYAQSIDGCIAAARGVPTRLSGPESMVLTHELRARHDAILVGVGTVLADDPSLSTRLVAGPSPRPIVLDSRLRTPVSARLFRALEGGAPRRPIIICDTDDASPEFAARARALGEAGASVVRVRRVRSASPGFAGASPGFEAAQRVRSFLAALTNEAPLVRAVMVEGGAEVIRSFLAAGVVDALCITTAPLLLAGGPRFGDSGGHGGSRGGEGDERVLPSRIELGCVAYEQLGEDVVLFATVETRASEPRP